jgi:hypothetical protein
MAQAKRQKAAETAPPASEDGGAASETRPKIGRPPGKKATAAAKPKGKPTKGKGKAAKTTTPKGKGKAKVAGKKTAKAAAKVPSKPATQAYEGSKKDFVLSISPDVKPADVVELAREKGMDLSANYVSGIRSVAKKTAGAPKRGPGRPRKTDAAAAAAATSVATPKRRGRPPKSATPAAAAAVSEVAPAPKKLGRPRKVVAEAAAPAATGQTPAANARKGATPSPADFLLNSALGAARDSASSSEAFDRWRLAAVQMLAASSWR